MLNAAALGKGRSIVIGYGANFLTGGTASGTGGTPANAVDGNTGTDWNSGITSNARFIYNLGSGVSKTPAKIRIYGRDAGGNLGVKNFDVDVSATGAFAGEETTVYTGITTNTVGAWQEFTFVNETGARYVSLLIVDTWNGGVNAGLKEIEMMEASGYA